MPRPGLGIWTSGCKIRTFSLSVTPTTVYQCNTQRKPWCVMNTVSGLLLKHKEPKVSMVHLNRELRNVVTGAIPPTTFLCPEGPAHEHGLCSFHLVTIDDVRKCLCSVDPAKAVGSDMIPGLVLKSCASVAEPLTHIVNASLTAGCVPTAFKMSHVSSLYKSGDVTMGKKHKRVSLLLIVSRIFEYFVCQQVTDNLTQHKLFPESQFAYKRQHSTEDAVVLAIDRWLMAKAEFCLFVCLSLFIVVSQTGEFAFFDTCNRL